MIDKQIEMLFNAITDFENFQSKILSSEDIILNKEIGIYFENNSVRITFSDKTEKISREEFDHINEEIKSQQKSNLIFNDIVKHKLTHSGISVNIREDKTFLVTDEYIGKFMHAPQTSSSGWDIAWYVMQLRDLIRLFDLGYLMICNDKKLTKQEFVTEYFVNATHPTLEQELYFWEGLQSLDEKH